MWIETPIGKAHAPLDINWARLPKIPDEGFPQFKEALQELDTTIRLHASSPIFAKLILQREASAASPHRSGGRLSEAAYVLSPFVPFHIFDSFEALNYACAAEFALSSSADNPFSIRHLNGVHKRLLPASDLVGRLRTGHIWIGPRDTGPENAAIILTPSNHIRAGLHALAQAYNTVPPSCRLQAIAMMHLQFISIHPYVDGNGRMTRLLTASMLLRACPLPIPLMVSNQMWVEDAQYRAKLIGAEQHGQFRQWTNFLIDLFAREARSTMGFILRIKDLRNKLYSSALELLPKKNAERFIDHILLSPTIARSKIQELTGRSGDQLHGLIKNMEGWQGFTMISDIDDNVFQFSELLRTLLHCQKPDVEF